MISIDLGTYFWGMVDYILQVPQVVAKSSNLGSYMPQCICTRNFNELLPC